MCTASFLCPAVDEGDHEDIVGYTTNPANIDVNRQSTRILKRDFHSIDIQVFHHHETVLSNLKKHRHDQDSSSPMYAPELSRTNLTQQVRETRSEYSPVYDGSLIFIEWCMRCVVHGGVIHTTRGLFSRRYPFNFLVPPFVMIPVTVSHGMSALRRH